MIFPTKNMTFILTMSSLLSLVGFAKDTTYEIYPNPQHISYQDANFKISSEVNIIFEKGIDQYTKDRLAEILKSHNIKYKISGKTKKGKTNILIGTNHSGEFVDKYFNTNIKHQETFFDKIDSHIIYIGNQTIAVLGNSTDSAFYGVTTLKHIFNQINQKQIRSLRIDDYANVKHRGFIEGYYGNPWSNEDRAQLMIFGGDYKLNTYFFAPKDDVYHNSKWRELYPEKELAEIRKLAQVGNRTKNKYVYALHCFMHHAIRFDNEENYQNDLQIIKNKFTQLLKNDVRAFSILADDAGVPPQGPQTYVTLLNDLTAWLIEQKRQYPDLVTDIPFCPNDYMGNGSSNQLKITNKAPDTTSIIMTGGRIWGEVSEQFTSNFIKNIATEGHPGKPAYLWINWPCSDNSKQHLIMGGNATFLHPQVNENNIRGIILNPMQQAEANKSALFAIADYSWNIWDNNDQAEQNWHDSFKYMNHGTAKETKSSTALREISKHMINQNMDGRVRALQESIELAPKLNAFKDKLKTGSISKKDTVELIKEFQALQDAANYYRKNPGSPRTQEQIIYWLHCWQDTTDSAINYLKALDSVMAGNNDQIWNYYATAQAAFEKSKTYKFRYVNHYEKAEVGVQHIVPFIKNLGQHLNSIVAGIVDPNKTIEQYISSREDSPGNIAQIQDGDAKTGVVYKNPSELKTGDFVGISYNRPIKIDNIDFQLGTTANPQDTFSKARVEITKDGKKWETLNDTIYDQPQEIKLEKMNITAQGVRVIATSDKGNTWLGVREITINKQDNQKEISALYTNTTQKIATTIELDKATIAAIKSITLQPKEYLGIKLDRIKELKSIEIKTCKANLLLQTSANGVEWEVFNNKRSNARYARLINTTNKATTFNLDKFVVTSNEIKPITIVKQHAQIYNNSKAEQAFDGDFNTTVFFNKGFNKGESIVYDLGQTIAINNLKYVVLDTDTDHIRDAKFQLSNDGENWTDAFEIKRSNNDGNSKPQDNGYLHGSLSNGIIPISHSYLEGKNIKQQARFIRILATDSYTARWIRISELLINNGEYIRTINNPTFVTKPIEIKGHEPECMIDGDLTTSYRPNTDGGKIKNGEIIYRLSEKTSIKQINIVQDGNAISNAKISIRTGENKWQEIGKLDKSLTQLQISKQITNIFEIKITWDKTPPTIYQIVTIPVK